MEVNNLVDTGHKIDQVEADSLAAIQILLGSVDVFDRYLESNFIRFKLLLDWRMNTVIIELIDEGDGHQSSKTHDDI